jgi:hypothetical protein
MRTRKWVADATSDTLNTVKAAKLMAPSREIA